MQKAGMTKEGRKKQSPKENIGLLWSITFHKILKRFWNIGDIDTEGFSATQTDSK